MDKIIIVDKPANVTSRSVVNEISKILNTKKVGHTGTLDPIATGVLVICVGKATKLVDVLSSSDKEYIATVKQGILTDTLDTEGKIIKTDEKRTTKEKLVAVLNSFVGFYNQQVPLYSAVKINGKKLYEYARSNKKVNLPKRMVNIKEIELLEFNKDYYKFRVLVSKGTYIRSLIKDINDELNIIGVMSNLVRIRQGNYHINFANTIDDIKNNNYKFLSITDVLKDNYCIKVDELLYDKIKNGALIDNIYKKDMVKFMYNNEIIAIYKVYQKDESKLKPYKMFI